MAIVLSLVVASRRAAVTAERLHAAQRGLAALADGPSEAAGRAAIAWGYAERMRLGLESPFRLIEAASLDSRLTLDERRTVSWALLATLLRGESHQVDPAALDLLARGSSVRGEAHLAIVESRISAADDPRAAELALRFAYALAASERLIASSGQTLIAQTAALVADREIARREAGQLLRATKANDLIAAIAQSRRRRELYVERPVLMTPPAALEQRAVEMVPAILAELRAIDGQVPEHVVASDSLGEMPPLLFAAARRALPSAVVGVTTRRFLPALGAELSPTSISRIAQASNPEMFVSAITGRWSRSQRRLIGRLQLAVAVATRTHAQDPVWFAGDAATSSDQAGVRSVSFDGDVPAQWRPYYLASLDHGIRNLRVVFPELNLDAVNVRFRIQSPADSALAMHEPRTRTLHLPVFTAAGTLTHEIAHDLDRQVSVQQGRGGYWSDVAARGDGKVGGSANRVAASLRTLSGEMSVGFSGPGTSDRPAEIFATRVDWFVAQALARQGMTSGFLSAVQDEVLTGHVLHTERLRGAGRSRSLITALEGMTTVAPFAQRENEPTAYSLMQFVLRAPLDRRAMRLGDPGFVPVACEDAPRGRAALLRLAAQSRARGIVRGRAESIPPSRRPAWARASLGEAPWASDAATERVNLVAAGMLGQLTAPGLQVGTAYRAAALLRSAPCGG